MRNDLHTCEHCMAVFYYDPRNHRCEGEWEAMAGRLDNSHANESWADECVRKVMS